MSSRDMLTSSETASPPDVIINACDPIQNRGQTRIFYKAGQTRLTRAKRYPDDPTRFQPWICLMIEMVIGT